MRVDYKNPPEGSNQRGDENDSTRHGNRIMLNDSTSDPPASITRPPAVEIIEPILEAAQAGSFKLDPKSYDFSDDDNAALFVDLFGAWVRHEAVNREWRLYDRTRWVADAWGVSPELAKFVAKLRQQWLGHADPRELRDASKFVQRSRSAAGIRAMLYLAAADPRIATTITEYDRCGYLINTPGGVIDVRNPDLRLRPHRAEDMITKRTRFTPEARDGELWPTVLQQASCSRDDWKQALQRICGSGALGLSNKDKAAINFGSGANLKDTTIETSGLTLGEYAGTCSVQSLMEQHRSSGHAEDIASLRGIRYLRTSEPTFNGRIDEGRFKELTGGGVVSASHKHGRQFSFTPVFTLMISTNHKPRILGRDLGVWRRVWLLPFDYTIPEADRDPRFKERLLEIDGPAILHWLLVGARAYIKHGWGNFPTIEAATAEYQAKEDILGAFLQERCRLGEFQQIKASELRELYEKWCDEQGERPFTGRAWREALEERGFQRKKLSAGFYWVGIGKDDDVPF